MQREGRARWREGRERKRKGKSGKKRREQGKGKEVESKTVAQWANELGLVRSPEEAEGSFQARVSQAVQTHKRGQKVSA